MKILLALLLVLAGAGAAEYYALRQRAAASCRSALMLSRHAPAVAAWLRQAEADPFLGEAALRGPPNGVLAAYRDRARGIGGGLSARFLPAEPVAAFQRLALARGSGAELAQALEALRPAVARLECPAASSPEEDLGTEVHAADLFMAERHAVSLVERQEFARDKAIFCHGEDLLAKLRGVAASAAEKCRAAKEGTKLAKSCASGAASAGLEAEIHDLEKEKELNLRKLRQKWPAGVVAGLAC